MVGDSDIGPIGNGKSAGRLKSNSKEKPSALPSNVHRLQIRQNATSDTLIAPPVRRGAMRKQNGKSA
jgi:hypothetical protein